MFTDTTCFQFYSQVFAFVASTSVSPAAVEYDGARVSVRVHLEAPLKVHCAPWEVRVGGAVHVIIILLHLRSHLKRQVSPPVKKMSGTEGEKSTIHLDMPCVNSLK